MTLYLLFYLGLCRSRKRRVASRIVGWEMCSGNWRLSFGGGDRRTPVNIWWNYIDYGKMFFFFEHYRSLYDISFVFYPLSLTEECDRVMWTFFLDYWVTMVGVYKELFLFTTTPPRRTGDLRSWGKCPLPRPLTSHQSGPDAISPPPVLIPTPMCSRQWPGGFHTRQTGVRGDCSCVGG